MCIIDIPICCCPCFFPKRWRTWQFQVWEQNERQTQRDQGSISLRNYPRQRQMSLSSIFPTPRSGSPDTQEESTAHKSTISIPMNTDSR